MNKIVQIVKLKSVLRRRFILELLVLLILSLTPILWYREGNVFLGHDAGFRLSTWDHLKNIFFSWSPINGFGADWSIYKGFLITQLPEALFSSVFQTTVVWQISTFIFWFFVIGLSMYIFLYAFFPQKEYWILRLFASVFYMYNFFLLQGWFIVERAKFSLFAALPLGFLVLYKTLNGEYSLIKGTFFFSLIFLFLNGGSSPPLFGAVLLVYAITWLYFCIKNYLQEGVTGFIVPVKTLIFFSLGFVTVNAYWIFPQIYLITNKYSTALGSVGGIEGILSWEKMVNQYASLLNLFRLQGIPDWYNNQGHAYANEYLSNPILIVASFLFVTVILSGLILEKSRIKDETHKNIIVLFLFVLLAAMIFASGSHDPFGPLYIFLIEHLPGFAIFRSAFYKFGPAVWFSIIFLTGYFLNSLALRYKNNHLLYSLIGVGSLVFILTYHFPYFQGNFFHFNAPFSTRVRLPQYVRDMSEYVNARTPGDSRILMMPPFDLDFQVDGYTWGYWSIDNLPRLTMDRSIISNDGAAPEIASNLYDSLENSTAFLQVAGMAGINKILWRDDILYSDKKTTAHNVSHIYEQLRSIDGVTHEKNFGNWSLYTLDSPYFLPRFYSPENVYNIYGETEGLIDLAENNLLATSSGVISNSTSDMSYMNDLITLNVKQLKCVYCELKEFEKLKNSIALPTVRFLPNSLFYFLIRNQESKLLASALSPDTKTDAHLALSGKRLVEIEKLLQESNAQNRNELVRNTFHQYTLHTDIIMKQLQQLSDIQKNEYAIKVLAYFEVHRNLLEQLADKYPDLITEKEMSAVLTKASNLREMIIMGDTYDDKLFMFEIENDGVYDFLIQERNPRERMLLDGNEIADLNNLELQRGVHILELQYPRTLLSQQMNQQQSEISLLPGESKTIMSHRIQGDKEQIISFSFSLIKGSRPQIALTSINDDNQRKITSIPIKEINDTQNVEYVYTPSQAGETITISASNVDFEKTISEFKIDAIQIIPVILPRVYLIEQKQHKIADTPTITYERINQIHYNVHIQKASQPYLLVFGEQFDPGWKAAIDGSSKNANIIDKMFTNNSVSEEHHIMVNQFANAWYIDKTGDYTIQITFWPQSIFYIGIVVTVASFTGLLILYLRHK